MPVVSTGVIDSYEFDKVTSDSLVMKASNSSTATESSSDNRPGSPQRSGVRNKSPHRSPTVTGNPRTPERSMIHTRTNFGKTRGYVPPLVPSSPSRVPVGPPTIPPPGPRRNTNLFDDDDAPDDEAQFRTVRSLRPKSAPQYHSDGSARRRGGGRLHRRTHSGDAVASPRPEAYISETDDSSMGQRDLSFETTKVPSSQARSLGQEERHASPEDEPFDTVQARQTSPIENIEPSPIRPSGKETVPENPNHRSAEELAELRHRRRRENLKTFEMPTEEVNAPLKSITSTKTSDLTEESMEPMPSFDQGVEETKELTETEMEYQSGSEMEYHSEQEDMGPPSESARYEEFGRETSDRDASARKGSKPKSILKSKGISPRDGLDDGADEDDDDSLFDFAGNQASTGASNLKPSLKNGNTGSSRKGRRPRRKSDEGSENDDDESLIQYGEHRKRSSSLQERTQQAWTFRSQRSFPKANKEGEPSLKKEGEPSLKKEAAGVQFGNKDTIHHFDDNETLMTTGTGHSLNSLYTKSPESEAEDLIKDLLLIGSGEHSNPGRRKLKYQPEYKRQLRGDDRSIDENTLGTTDVSLNTLDYTAGGTAYSEATPYTEVTGVTDDASLETFPHKRNTISRISCEAPNSKVTESNEVDPLAIMWGYVESGMQALGLASSPTKQEKIEKDKPKENETKAVPTTTAKEVLVEEEWDRKNMAEAKENEEFPEVQGIESTYAAEDYPADEVKEDGKGSFGEVMDYLFGDPMKQQDQV